MRRFFAFLIMLVSVVASVLFNGQSVIDHMVYSSEYGGGREVVYQLTKRQSGHNLRPDEIGDLVTARLDVAGVKDGHVEVTGSGEEAQLRVSFAPANLEDYNNVLLQIGASGSLSVCNKDDYCLTGDEFFASKPMSLRYLGSQAYPAFNIKSKIAAQKMAETLGEEEGASVYIWQNRDPESGEDNYENAFGENPKDEVKAKVVASVVWQGNYLEDETRLYVTADKNGNAFTITSAKAFVSAYNAADYGFDIEKLYETYLAPTLGANAFTATMIGIGVALLIVGVALILLYGYSGAVTFASLLAGLTVSIFVFSYLGFQFSPAAVIGLVAIAILGVFTTVNYLEKIKDELKKGRTIAKANSEGYRKSFFVTLDSCAVTFFVSLFIFLFGAGALRTFGGVMFIGSLAIFLITNFLSKWMMYWMTTSDTIKKSNGTFGLRMSSKSSPLTGKTFYSEGKDRKKRNIGGLVGGALLLLSGAAILTTGLIGDVFNNSDNYSPYARLNVKTTCDDDAYQDEERFLAYLSANNIEIDYDSLDFQRVDKKDEYGDEYKITFVSFATAAKDVDSYSKLESLMLNDDDEAVVTNETTRVVNIDHDTSSLFLVFGLSILFASLYLFARYGISVFISTLAGNIVIGATAVGLFAGLRLPYNSYSGFGLLALVVVMGFFSIAMFARNKDALKDQKIAKTASLEQRSKVLDTAFFNSLPAAASCALIALLSAVSVIVATGAGALLGEFLIFALAMIVGFAFASYFVGPFYLFLRTHIRFKEFHFKWKRKPRKPVQINLNEPHETIIPGINDFR